ncbi:MAG: TlpA family protein disulfide reductase [Gloeobacteraceae cyanobacterium ES-bin-316]|nr:TlpA family protein disulfide reductase [Ferruginibacter sp.]
MKKMIIFLIASIGLLNLSAQQIPKWKITDVEKYMNNSENGVMVINFWATFCKPCVAEIPSFIKITNQHKSENVKLMLVSLDLPSYYPAKIASFAKKQKFDANIVWLEETDADYFCPRIDKSWSGSIPATLFLNPRTGYRKFFEEEIDAATFENELKVALADKPL